MEAAARDFMFEGMAELEEGAEAAEGGKGAEEGLLQSARIEEL